jgi:hypothetical protein
MGQTFGEDNYRAGWAAVLVHGGAHAFLPGRFTYIGAVRVRTAVTEMRLMRTREEGSTALSGLYLFELPHHARKPGKDLIARHLVAHGVGLLRRAHHMGHARAIAVGGALPAGRPHGVVVCSGMAISYMNANKSHLKKEHYWSRCKHIMSKFFYVPLICFPLIPLSPLIGSWAWPSTHETDRYIILLHCFREAFLQGFLYPRWIPSLLGGYGYPTFCFYQPGFFYFALPFSFLPGYPFATIQLTLYTIFLIGTVGMYKLCSELAGRGIAMICLVIFLFTPYLYVNLYVRGDLSELTSMLLCPWPLFFLLRLKKRVEQEQRSYWPLICLAFTLAAVIVSHPATALLFFAIIGVITVVC